MFFFKFYFGFLVSQILVCFSAMDYVVLNKSYLAKLMIISLFSFNC